MQMLNRNPAMNLSWLWTLLPLLLAASLVVPVLGRDVFDVDESSTMTNAGARHLGPFTPAEAVHTSVTRSPDQAWGHAVVFSQWGRVAGWSELAMRTLPWFAGLLTLAWVYRLGRALFTARIALTATLLLSTSVAFLTYMHIARPYAFALLFTAIVLWAYWRVALHPLTPGRGARAALMLGATGLLYTHYFSALLLPALAVFHLFFVCKERRWWQPVILLGMATLLALPQVPDLLKGIEFNQGKEQLHTNALHYPEATALLVRNLSNGLLQIEQPVSLLLALALPLPLFLFGWRNRNRRQLPEATWYLSLVSVLLFLSLLAVNELLQVLEKKRVRYLLTLWPPVTLLTSLALLHRKRPALQPPVGLVLAVMVAVAGASDFLNEGELIRASWRWSASPVSIAATHVIATEGSTDGLLVADRGLFQHDRVYEFYTGAYGDHRVILEQKMPSIDILERAQGRDRVWIMLRSSLLVSPKEDFLNVHAHLERFRQEGWFHCRSWQEDDTRMELLRSPLPAARLDQARLQFENDIELFAPVAPELRDGLLRFRARLSSADETLLSRYSLALHVIDTLTGERVAQGDIGVGPGALVPLCREIDVSALPPGDYEVRVALYDWQTGTRLPARNLETDEVSDMHTLHRFRLD